MGYMASAFDISVIMWYFANQKSFDNKIKNPLRERRPL